MNDLENCKIIVIKSYSIERSKSRRSSRYEKSFSHLTLCEFFFFVFAHLTTTKARKSLDIGNCWKMPNSREETKRNHQRSLFRLTLHATRTKSDHFLHSNPISLSCLRSKGTLRNYENIPICYLSLGFLSRTARSLFASISSPPPPMRSSAAMFPFVT